MTISIIVPVLNEAAQMLALTAHLNRLREQGCEILIVDGGSTDLSMPLADDLGFTALRGPQGRARQMNIGAAHATGELLLFLHADTRLPDNAVPLLRETLADPLALWGRFDVQIEGRSVGLKVIAFLMNWRSRRSGIATGDQAIFVRRAIFHAVGGYRNQALMEDIALCKELKQLARPHCFRAKVITSGRRWEKSGVWRTVWLMWRLRYRYWRGESADVLAADYQ